MPTLKDNRVANAMTVEDADALMRDLAECEVQIAKLTAEAEAKITALKARLAERCAPLEARSGASAVKMADYIDNHHDRFAKPRARKTPFGSYGLRQVSNIEIADRNALLEHVISVGLENCYSVTYKLDMAGIAKAISDGYELPGVSVQTGERSFYKVAKSLIDEAKKALEK